MILLRTIPGMLRRGSTWRARCAAGAALLCCYACGSSDGNGAGASHSKRGVILISLDTLRADRLGCYGYERPTSPHMDALAARGTVFENTIAEAPWTLPAHASMLTGLFPAAHGVTRPSRRLRSGTATLAQTLMDAGFTTIGLTEGGYLARDYGLSQGFQIYSENRPDLATTLDTARDLLSQVRTQAPFLMFLHTFDVHCPYDPPPEHIQWMRTDDEQAIETADSCGVQFNEAPLTPGQVRTLSNRYDAGIHSVDALLGAFFEELQEQGVLDDIYVVITSDHGEELYEHGRIGHERTVHQEALRVPWIVIGPDVVQGRISSSAGLTDIAPTVLDLLGVQPPDSMQGRSRAAELRGTAHAEDELRFSELDWKTELYSVITDTHQLIVDGERRTLLRLGEPGGETSTQEMSELERRYMEALQQHLLLRTQTPAPTIDALDPDQQERLRALGYGD
ncbi:MAG: arylsulfatase A-like enzyme [Chlamydiales bacterium]|jgi:arylsulfatase A-like enzyme